MPISHNWQWWMVGLDIHGPLQKGSRCPFILGLQLRDTDPPDLNDPHLLPQKQGLGHFGYRLAKAWLGHQEAWIIVGSANHMGLTAFMEESWHLMVIEVMKSVEENKLKGCDSIVAVDMKYRLGILRMMVAQTVKGNQPWIFIGRTDAEAKAPVLWPSDTKS